MPKMFYRQRWGNRNYQENMKKENFMENNNRNHKETIKFLLSKEVVKALIALVFVLILGLNI